MGQPGWAVVVPVKRLSEAKSRLRRPSLGIPHTRLVLAMARDTVSAVAACPSVAEVLTVTDDPVAARALASLGARVVPDAPRAGMNAAATHGAAVAAAGGRPVSVIAADLPALHPGDLAAALRAAGAAAVSGHGRAFVADATGTGTTMLAAAPGVALAPRFGPGSAAAHAASGAHRLDGGWPSLRRDVDTATDLAAAAALGLGDHTAWLLPDSAAPVGERAAGRHGSAGHDLPPCGGERAGRRA